MGYRAEAEEGAPSTSSSQEAAKTELLASAGTASASGIDLHANDNASRSSLQKLKTQVDSMASR